MIQVHWEHFPHDADMGVRGIGDSKEKAFEQAAVALTAVIAEPATVCANECVELSCEGPDDELLLVNWLNDVIFEMATRKMLFGRYQVSIAGNSLRGKAWGEAMDASKHDLAVEVKGATCTALAVKRENGAWIAQCVVDV